MRQLLLFSAVQQRRRLARPQQYPPQGQPGPLADLLDGGDLRRGDGRGQDRLGAFDGGLDRQEIQTPAVVQLVELPRGLEADEIGKIVVAGRRHRELPQLDPRAADGNQCFRPPAAPRVELLRDPRAEVVGRFVGAARERERMFDHDLPPAQRRNRGATFGGFPR